MSSINTRIVMKHDTSENWAKAVNFIPLEGELIVYQDYDSNNNPLAPKFKNGDGKTKVNDLPFSTDIEAGGSGLNKLVVTSLPATPEDNTIYLLKEEYEVVSTVSHTMRHGGSLSSEIGLYVSGFGEDPEIDALFYPVSSSKTYTITPGDSLHDSMGFVVRTNGGTEYSDHVCLDKILSTTFSVASSYVDGTPNGIWINVKEGTTPVLQTTETTYSYTEYMVVNGKYELISSIRRIEELERKLGDVEAALDAILKMQEELMPKKPTFTIQLSSGGTETCTFEEGMTWSDWCSSEYNTIGAQVENDTWIDLDGHYIRTADSFEVSAWDSITAGETYYA